MTTPPPEHSGLRPLSPYGEGYCKACQFVIGLDCDGRVAQHWRGAHGLMTSRECKGSGWKPPKVTPYSSRKAAFTANAPDVRCPECERVVRSTAYGGAIVYAQHYPHPASGVKCPFSLRAIVKG